MIEINSKKVVSLQTVLLEDGQSCYVEFREPDTLWKFDVVFAQDEKNPATRVESVGKGDRGEIKLTNVPKTNTEVAIGEFEVGSYISTKEKIYLTMFIQRVGSIKRVDLQFLRGK
jgi:hypothetical protein